MTSYLEARHWGSNDKEGSEKLRSHVTQVQKKAAVLGLSTEANYVIGRLPSLLFKLVVIYLFVNKKKFLLRR